MFTRTELVLAILVGVIAACVVTLVAVGILVVAR